MEFADLAASPFDQGSVDQLRRRGLRRQFKGVPVGARLGEHPVRGHRDVDSGQLPLLFRSEDPDSQPLATRAEELSPWTVGRSRVRGIGHFGRLPGSEGPFRMILQTAGEVAARQVRSTIASWRRPVDFSYCSATRIASAREMPAAPAGVGSSLSVDAAGRLHERNFAPPKARPGDVVRERILARTAGERARRIVAIDGPAGCGKTTFAAQECALDVRPTAWVNLRDLDNDPFRLLTRLVQRAG